MYPVWNSTLPIYLFHQSSYNSRKTPHISPVRATYGVLFVRANLAQVLNVLSIIYAISPKNLIFTVQISSEYPQDLHLLKYISIILYVGIEKGDVWGFK